MRDDEIIVHNGIVLRLIEDDAQQALYTIGQYADTLGKRMAYYEIRYCSDITAAQREQMIQHVKEIAR